LFVKGNRWDASVDCGTVSLLNRKISITSRGRSAASRAGRPHCSTRPFRSASHHSSNLPSCPLSFAPRAPDDPQLAADEETLSGELRALEARLREEGHKRVRSKIDAGAFENWLLDLRAGSEDETILEERDA
jgi:hypothetical protein